MKKTICIYHSKDLDGQMSAAIVKKWFIKNNKHAQISDYPEIVDYEVHKTSNILTMLGWHYGDPKPDLSAFDKIIMCDISFSKYEMRELASDFGINFIWIDHHSSIINELTALQSDQGDFSAIDVIEGLHDINYAACELTWQFFFPNEKMPEIVRLLGRYDCFGHKQQWCPVIGYEGCYEVSNQGNVRSVDRIIIENNTNKKKQLSGQNLSMNIAKDGYRVVVLSKNGKEITKKVHRLVGEAFIPNPENKPCVNHKDSNKLNNYQNNIEWCTYLENNLHSINNGNRGKSVIQLNDNKESIRKFESLISAEKYTGVSAQNIGKVCKGERQFAGKYRWEYGEVKETPKQFVPINEEKLVLEFQYGARQVITNYEEAAIYLQQELNATDLTITNILDKGKTIYNYVCSEAKQIYSRAFPVTFQNPSYGGGAMGQMIPCVMPKVNFLCVNHARFNPINFDIDYHKEGYDGFACFWLNGDKWNFSFYNDNGEVNCSLIAKRYGGGGHAGAAGAVVSSQVMLKIIR